MFAANPSSATISPVANASGNLANASGNLSNASGNLVDVEVEFDYDAGSTFFLQNFFKFFSDTIFNFVVSSF